VTQVDARPATWLTVCRLDDLLPERGVAALVGGHQVALVRLVDDTLYAVDQLDPFSGAHVMSRGIVGTATVGGEVVPTLASPMYKQVFDLRTGRCLADREVRLGTWTVREVDGLVQVLAAADAGDGSEQAGTPP
jgi:nitrite reductase (NADH) small subunit